MVAGDVMVVLFVIFVVFITIAFNLYVWVSVDHGMS